MVTIDVMMVINNDDCNVHESNDDGDDYEDDHNGSDAKASVW